MNNIIGKKYINNIIGKKYINNIIILYYFITNINNNNGVR